MDRDPILERLDNLQRVLEECTGRSNRISLTTNDLIQRFDRIEQGIRGVIQRNQELARQNHPTVHRAESNTLSTSTNVSATTITGKGTNANSNPDSDTNSSAGSNTINTDEPVFPPPLPDIETALAVSPSTWIPAPGTRCTQKMNSKTSRRFTRLVEQVLNGHAAPADVRFLWSQVQRYYH